MNDIYEQRISGYCTVYDKIESYVDKDWEIPGNSSIIW